MWRGDLSNETNRINNFIKDAKKIAKLFKYLIKKKIIKKVYVFPYTKSFLINSILFNFFNGACVYRNPMEKVYDNLVNEIKGFNFITIRPFGGNLKLIKKHKLKYLLNYSINNKNINNIILTCSKKKQIDEIVSYCNDKKNF
jgi:hypothetical protein